MKRKESLFRDALNVFASQISSLPEKIDQKEVKEFATALHRIDHMGCYIFVFGRGRSQLIGEAFATRLSNLGYNVFIIGDSVTPAIRKRDGVIFVSGSGETDDTVRAAQRAKKIGAIVFGITSKPDSTMAKYCDHLLKVPGRSRIDRGRDYLDDQIKGRYAPLAPMGTLFEISAMIVLDSIIPEIARLKGFDEAEMRKRHFEY